MAKEAAEQLAMEVAVKIERDADRIPKEGAKRFAKEATDILEWLERKKKSLRRRRQSGPSEMTLGKKTE